MWDSWIGLVLNIGMDLEGSDIGGYVFMGFSGGKGKHSRFGSAPRYGWALDGSLYDYDAAQSFLGK